MVNTKANGRIIWQGYVINQKRLEYLVKIIGIAVIIDDELNNDEAKEILIDLIMNFITK